VWDAILVRICIGDYLSQPTHAGGIGLGTVVTSVIFLGAILALVVYLSVTHSDEIPVAVADERERIAPRQD